MGSIRWYLSYGCQLRLISTAHVHGVWQLWRVHQKDNCECNGKPICNDRVACTNLLQCFIAYCAGNIIGPQLFFEREAPSYSSGFVALIVCQTACFVLCLCLRFYLLWVNRGRDQNFDSADSTDTGDAQTHALMAMLDKTDKEIEGFRYVY